MIGDRTRIAEVYIFGTIVLLGAAAYLLTLAAKASTDGRERHRAKLNAVEIDAIKHHERVLELETEHRRQEWARGKAAAHTEERNRRFITPAEGPAEVQPGTAGDA